jgi:outer membrane beta-barrel protein
MGVQTSQSRSLMISALCVLVVAFTLVGALTPQRAAAQEELEPAEGEGTSSLITGPPIRHQILLRQNRIEIQPTFGASLGDPFVRNMLVGLMASYHFTNSLGISLSANYAVAHFNTDEVDIVASDGFLNNNVKDQLNVTQLQLAFDLGLIWAPFTGKMSAFGAMINYDFHFFLGAGGLNFAARCADDTRPQCSEYDNLGGFTFGAAVGGGGRIFFNNYIALTVEFRDYLASFSEYARGPEEDNAEFRNFFVLTGGVSFFLPINVYSSR